MAKQIDRQFQFRKKLSGYLNILSQHKSVTLMFGGSGALDDMTLRYDLAVDRIMAEAKKRLARDEYAMLVEWVEKEKRVVWDIG